MAGITVYKILRENYWFSYQVFHSVRSFGLDCASFKKSEAVIKNKKKIFRPNCFQNFRSSISDDFFRWKNLQFMKVLPMIWGCFSSSLGGCNTVCVSTKYWMIKRFHNDQRAVLWIISLFLRIPNWCEMYEKTSKNRSAMLFDLFLLRLRSPLQFRSFIQYCNN